MRLEVHQEDSLLPKYKVCHQAMSMAKDPNNPNYPNYCLVRVPPNPHSEGEPNPHSEGSDGTFPHSEGDLQVLRLAARGFLIFPVMPRGKVLLVKWKSAATSDLLQIEQWLRKYPGCNWAIATGGVSNIFVLDIDGASGLRIESADLMWRVQVRNGSVSQD